MNQRDKSIIESHEMGLSHAEIARDFDLSRERVRQIVERHLGDSTPKNRKTLTRRNLAVEALKHIDQGGHADEIAADMNLSVNQLDKLLAEQVGLTQRQAAFQAWMGEQIGQRFGEWIVLGMEPHQHGSTSRMRSRATARCSLCDTVHKVGYRNLITGASTMCHRCGCKHGHRGQPVQDLLSGVIYRSLKDAARAQGLTYGQAQYGLRRRANARFKRLAARKPAQESVAC